MNLLVSVEEAALALGIGRSLACELIASGALPHLKVGRRTLVPTRALEAWVAGRVLAKARAIEPPNRPKTQHIRR